MKKFLALLLALVMALSLFACGKKDDNKDPDDNKVVKADDIKDEMTSADGKYEIAFVTDVGALKDKSFNQGTYDGVKLYANANNLSYKYYQPANAMEAQAMLTALMTQKYDGPQVIMRRASDILFETSHAISWTIDGEYGGSFVHSHIVNNKNAVTLIV